MSHHYSGPDFGFPHGDARLDFTDLYAFPKPGDAGKSILIMNVHPSASENPPGPTTSEAGGEAVPTTVATETARGADAAKQPAQPAPVMPAPASHGARRWWLRGIGGVGVLVALIIGVPRFVQSWHTVSTDDAFVNGYVTFVAPRVAGQVTRVLVDDNNRVRQGDLLVQLDKEPFQVQVNIAQAAVAAAQSDLVAAEARVRSTLGQMRSLRFSLDRAQEDVNNQVALLRSKVATLQSEKASLARAQADYDRAVPLVSKGAVSREELDRRHEALLVAQARVEEALQGVYQVRVALGLPPKPATGDDLAQVPADLNQTFSTVRQAQASLLQAAAEVGVTESFNKSPAQLAADFYKRDPQGNIDRIFAGILPNAPAVKQAEAKLLQAQRNLDQALLNLRYCDVVAEIDGVVTRRDVNPGNNVVAGQSLMAVRSLKEIWVDANFKETQLASLRIGQAVDVYADMYGRRQHFKGRISGFTMGTGSTLALLPAQNATGNFVKVVQRLPVRIDLMDHDQDKTPLFIGLSVTPYVRLNEAPTGPHAGDVLQSHIPTTAPTSGPASPR
jgi:membrane fusion protein, multidrug efflux system